MRAVQLTAFGNPVDGLECVDIPEPDTPGPNQVLIGVEYSPINPNDLMVAQGIYAFRPPLPAVIGNEGVGRVLAIGPGVESVRLGDRVLAPLSSFTWRERIVISAGGLSALPADAAPQQLAMLAINPPTAALLLSEYVDLQPGEWVVQNAANSGVGRWVIAFAKTRGLKTVNIVRRPELVAELEAIGGDVVVVDSPDVRNRIKAAIGQAELRLAVDGVSGPATGVLAATLSPHGSLVSFAAMSEGPMSISPLDVIFKPLTMRGFWLGHPEIAAKIGPAIVQAAAMIASGRVHIPVAATYPLSSIKQAVAHAQRGGKILLDVAGSSISPRNRAFDMATTKPSAPPSLAKPLAARGGVSLMVQSAKPRVVGFNHVALEVGDIEEALAFYGRLFEFELRGKSDTMAFIDLGDQFIALQKGRKQPADDGRHFGLVVDDKEAARAALQAAGVTPLEGPFLDFRDPWGNRIEIVGYDNIQFTKAPNVLRGMGLTHLTKNENSQRELAEKGMALSQATPNVPRTRPT